MTFSPLDTVVLVHDIPQHGLRAECAPQVLDLDHGSTEPRK